MWRVKAGESGPREVAGGPTFNPPPASAPCTECVSMGKAELVVVSNAGNEYRAAETRKAIFLRQAKGASSVRIVLF